MAGIFASLAVRKALDKLSSFLPASLAVSSSSTAARARQEEDQNLEDLGELQRTMHRIKATLYDAEQHWNIQEETSKLRLKELKDFAYDAEDVVDAYEYEVNRCKVEALELSASSASGHKRKHHQENEGLFYDSGMVAVPDELAVEIKKLTKRFSEFKYYSDNFTLSEDDGERRFTLDIASLRKTSSVVFEKSIKGREEDKDKIVEKLLSMGGDNLASPVSVFAIVGMGGIGKTTLAQLAYNDSRVRHSFNMHAWVCVSEQFDVSNITKNIISSLQKKNCDLLELSILQEILVDQIKGKKVLLVLDDVWNERRDCWDQLCMPMMMNTELCKIIVTTRSERVARLVQTMPGIYYLNCLSFDESWSLFKQVAFTVDQENAPSELVEIGRAIVQKCKGLPLAIKTLGSMLHCETNEQRWRGVLESELWDLEQPRNEVLPSLELSYRHMPIYLKRCFVALSLYPKDYVFKKSEVVQLWKVLDLLQSDGHDNENEIGSIILNELIERSFLRPKIDVFNDDGRRVMMHALIHDLACFLSVDEFFRLDGDKNVEIPQNARYISIHNGASCEISIAPTSLRAIVVLPGATVNINKSEALFSNCEKLRALVLDEGCQDQDLPALMRRLKLLRHLKFVSRSPYAHFEVCWDHIDGLRGIGHLSNLHTLPPICLRNDRIIELRSLNKIKELSIDGLGLKLAMDGAKDARLHSKKHLQVLILIFDIHSPNRSQHHLELAESLRPHHSLRELVIRSYESPRYPCWLGDASYSKLTQIELSCTRTKHLPMLGDLPSLVSLYFVDMWLVQCIGHEFSGVKGFPSLRQLRFNRMPEWSKWSDAVYGGFPCLLNLSICGAHNLRLDNLKSIPFPSLVTLELHNCSSITRIPASLTLRTLCIDRHSFGTRQQSTTGPFLNALPSLEVLTIICRYTTSIPLEPQHLPSLRKLHLSCQNLLYCDGIAGLTSLRELKVWACPKLPIRSLLPRQLQTLDIRDFPAYHFKHFDC